MNMAWEGLGFEREGKKLALEVVKSMWQWEIDRLV